MIERIDASKPVLSPERLEELKKMRDELFNLEVELFKVLREE